MATASSVNKSVESKSSISAKMDFWFEASKFYATIIFIVIISLFLGFSIGTIFTKNSFDESAIMSGHAQYNPKSGDIEWKRCNGQ